MYNQCAAKPKYPFFSFEKQWAEGGISVVNEILCGSWKLKVRVDRGKHLWWEQDTTWGFALKTSAGLVPAENTIDQAKSDKGIKKPQIEVDMKQK